MGRVLLMFALLASCLACQRPDAALAAPAKLTVHFLDQDAACGLPRPMPGAWAFMDAGLWQPVDTVWTGDQGRAAIGRTAPRWVLLRDPDGEVHRIVLSDAPDPVRASGPSDREDADDQAEGLFIAWLWLGQILVGR